MKLIVFMKAYKEINIDDYNYDLPDERIAYYPLDKRDASKLLIYDSKIHHEQFYNIHNYLPNNHLIVFNNTKVIQARIIFKKESGAQIEIFCLEPFKPSDYNLAFQQLEKCQWKCIVGNSKKWKSGEIFSSYTINNKSYKLIANRIEKRDNESIVEFSWEADHTFSTILESIGKTPIPPYIKRQAEAIDKERYQTIYSKFKGSVAAPTAGLHFTDELIVKLKEKNINSEEVTLHVGAGTFQPVKSENIGGHDMHTEHFSISLSTIQNLKNNIGKIISVGTTTVRTLESIYWLGVQIQNKKNLDFPIVQQWEPYENKKSITVIESLETIEKYLIENHKEQLEAITQIIIVPGYEYKITNHLITNFHQPKSTLLLLVGAAIGETWKEVYKYALENDFRFLSYGDSCLFLDINQKSRN